MPAYSRFVETAQTERLLCAHSPTPKSRFGRERDYKTENKASLPRSEEFIDHWVELTDRLVHDLLWSSVRRLRHAL